MQSRGAPEMQHEIVNVALVGSGRYASTYISVLQRLGRPVNVKYIWSRSEWSARKFQDENAFTKGAIVVSGVEQYASILQDRDLAAVLVVLPPKVAAEFALQAIKSGKAALSEKPIAESVAAARAFIEQYNALATPTPWLVGENWRFLPIFSDAGQIVSSRLGKVYKMDLTCDIPFTQKKKYLSSQWRRGELPGGFMVDTGVHQIATLRVLAAAAGAGAPLQVSATSTFDPEKGLSDPDTLMGYVTWQSGLRTSISFTLVAAFLRWSLVVTGEHGTLEVSHGAWNGRGDRMLHDLTFRTAAPDELKSKAYAYDGMERELDAFLEAAARWHGGASTGTQAADDLAVQVAKGLPEEALADLAILEAMIVSARQGETVQVLL